MYIGSHLKKFALKRGIKLWVTKHSNGDEVLNIYHVERDRLLCNFDGYNGKYLRGQHKLLNKEQFNRVPYTITNEQELTDFIKWLHQLIVNGEIE